MARRPRRSLGPHGRRPPVTAARRRWWDDAGHHWEVRARIERIVEPAVLAVLRQGDAHGYELAGTLASILPDETLDLGNLYRLLRSLEDEGLVRSRWRDDLPGRTKRTYELTADGEAVLGVWTTAPERAQRTIDDLVARAGE
jgi:DNA-binding PadR family transcriptional regulator